MPASWKIIRKHFRCLSKLHKIEGFTLIELLVVVAIVSLLSSIIIAALNSAKDRAGDSFIMSQMNQLRTQAEYYFQTHGVYGGSAAEDTFLECTGMVGSIFNRAESDSVVKFITLIYEQSKQSGHIRIVCGVRPASWALSLPLRSPPSNYNGWCMDSWGVSKYVYFPNEFDNQSNNKLISGGVAKCP